MHLSTYSKLETLLKSLVIFEEEGDFADSKLVTMILTPTGKYQFQVSSQLRLKISWTTKRYRRFALREGNVISYNRLSVYKIKVT